MLTVEAGPQLETGDVLAISIEIDIPRSASQMGSRKRCDRSRNGKNESKSV